MKVLEHNSYRELINEALKQKLGHGAKVKLADALNCNPGYISQVLSSNKIDFSPENIIKISHFLELDSTEEEYLLALLHWERSGSVELKKYWEKKIKALKKENSIVEKQIKQISQELSENAKSIYYSHWAYSAIHMVVSIDKFKSSEEIAKRLGISIHLSSRVVQFLEEHHLITISGRYFEIGKTRIHLKPDSPLIKSHHQNFRQKAMVSLENENEFDLHYSAVLTLSNKDAVKIRQMILNFISDKEKILTTSPNEEIIGLNLDIFKF